MDQVLGHCRGVRSFSSGGRGGGGGGACQEIQFRKIKIILKICSSRGEGGQELSASKVQSLISTFFTSLTFLLIDSTHETENHRKAIVYPANTRHRPCWASSGAVSETLEQHPDVMRVSWHPRKHELFGPCPPGLNL